MMTTSTRNAFDTLTLLSHRTKPCLLGAARQAFNSSIFQLAIAFDGVYTDEGSAQSTASHLTFQLINL